MAARVMTSIPGAALQHAATQARWVDTIDVGSLETLAQATTSRQNALAPLAVIPEDGIIDVARTPSIPEEAPFDPPSASSSIRRGHSHLTSPELKDWASIETKLECFARDLDVSPWSSFSSNKSSSDIGSGTQSVTALAQEALMQVGRSV